MKTQLKLRKEIKTMCDSVSGSNNQNFINLGKKLYKIKDEQIYCDWGYEKFQEYIDHELSISRRKISYLTHLYKRFFVDAKCVKKELVQEVGWSKASRIAECQQIKKTLLNKSLKMALTMSLREVDEYLITLRPGTKSKLGDSGHYEFTVKKSDREKVEATLKGLKKKYGIRKDRLLIKLVELLEEKL